MSEKAERLPRIPKTKRGRERQFLSCDNTYRNETSRERNTRRTQTTLASIALGLELVYFGGIEAPIWANELIFLPQTHASLSEVFPSVDAANQDSMALVIGGYGTRDSRPIAESLEPLTKLGRMYSIEEDNSGVDAGEIARQLIDNAEKNHIFQIDLWGDSAGGILVAEIGRIIQESPSPLRVRYIVLDCIPTSFESLRPDQQASMEAFKNISTIIPHAEDHFLASYLAADQKVKGDHNFSAIGGRGSAVLAIMNSNETPSATLLASQSSLILNGHLKDNLDAISRVTTKPAPLIISIRPTSPNGDKVVNSDAASEELDNIIHDNGLPNEKILIDGISHGDPTANRQAYQEIINTRIFPLVQQREQAFQEEEQRLLEIHRYPRIF